MHTLYTGINHIMYAGNKHRRRLFVLLLAITSLVFVACAGTTGSSGTTGGSSTSNYHTSTKTSDSQLTVTLDVSPNQVGQNTFTVHITGADGKAQTGDTVSLAESMTTMNMGTEVMPMQPDGKGGYTASGSIGMSGTSQLRVVIHTPDHVLHTATVMFDTTS